MTLETDLRAALHAHAAEIPISPRVTETDYHPRTRRVRPPVALGSIAGAGGITGVVLALSTSASTAFAGWKAQPTIPAAKQIALARASCIAGQSPIAGLPLKLSDTRGPFTFQIYASDTASAVCASGPSFRSISGQQSSGSLTPAAGKIESMIAHATNRDGDAYSFVDGRVGEGVDGVKLTLRDGSTVTATVQNGWFVAWWPSGQAAKSAEVTTPSGTTTQTVDDRNPCGSGNACTGRGYGIRSSGVVSVAHSRGVAGGLTISR